MKADISDAPERVIRKRHTLGVSYTVIFLVIGSLTTIGALPLINRARGPSVDSAYKQTVSPTGENEVLTRSIDMPPRQDLDSSRLRASSDIRLPANAARQTVFNDQNYTPRAADNVVALPMGPSLSTRTETSTKPKLTIVRQSLSMKERVCWPYRQGSIASRNCHAWVGLKHRD